MNGLRIQRTHRGSTCRTTDPVIAAEYAKRPDYLVITEGISDFSRYFKPILSCLHSYHWLFDGRSIWNLPKEWFDKAVYELATDRMRGPNLDKFEAEILEQKDNYLFAKPTFLEHYGDYLIDDWIDILGFKNPFCGGLELWNDYKGHKYDYPDRNAFLRNSVDICFFNIDGAYWEIFARDDRVLATVARHISSLKGFEVIELDLSEKTI